MKSVKSNFTIVSLLLIIIMFALSGCVVSTTISLDGSSEKNYFVIMICIVVGFWNVISPYSAWFVSHGWQYKDSEPSEDALLLYRILGLGLLIIGFIMVFI